MAQVPSHCLEIESILVDACISTADCPNSVEGHNEMVRFRIGAEPILTSELSVSWPNNNWQGITQNATTASLVATLNASIQSCGWLVEPSNDVLPAGAPVILVTSTDMCAEANSFAALGDTIHIIFQTAGNSAGHFVNHNNGFDTVPEPIGSSSFRTLIITHALTACADTAIYDRSLLVNIYGNYGGSGQENDGSTVLFSWPGTPQVSYINLGCQAPFEPIQITIAPPVGDLCTGGSVQLSAEATDGYTAFYWEGGTGTFSDPQALSTTYTAGPGEMGNVTLQFCAVSTCGDPICSSITLPAGEAPDVILDSGGVTEICAGEEILLIAIGNGVHTWNTQAEGDSISVDTPGTYTVTSTNACGVSSASITISSSVGPQVFVGGSTSICSGGSTTLTASGALDYSWSDGTTGPVFTTDVAGTYLVTGTNSCGVDAVTITIQEVDVQAAFTADVLEGEAPLFVQFLNLSLPYDMEFDWDLGDGAVSMDASPSHVFTVPGVYLVFLIASYNGCGDTAMVEILVHGPDGVDPQEEPSFIEIPNVFTPNGDGNNDLFQLTSQGITRIEMGIYNRWGQMVYEIKWPKQAWDGRSFAGMPAPEGTYFYELRAQGSDGRSHEHRGTVTLLR